jgi:hypothetical protein
MIDDGSHWPETTLVPVGKIACGGCGLVLVDGNNVTLGTAGTRTVGSVPLVVVEGCNPPVDAGIVEFDVTSEMDTGGAATAVLVGAFVVPPIMLERTLPKSDEVGTTTTGTEVEVGSEPVPVGTPVE